MKGRLLQSSHPPNLPWHCQSRAEKHLVYAPSYPLPGVEGNRGHRKAGRVWERRYRTYPTGQEAELQMPSPSTLSLIPTDFTYQKKFKDYIIKNFKMVTSQHSAPRVRPYVINVPWLEGCNLLRFTPPAVVWGIPTMTSLLGRLISPPLARASRNELPVILFS